MIVDLLRDVASLQLGYSSENTPEMQKRGDLIRHKLPWEFAKYEDRFQAILGRPLEDIGIEGRDGIGRKTQAPWVRIYSKEFSPSATTGFYVVIHFSADGFWSFVTVGCSATKWDNGKRDLVKSTAVDLERRVNWAKSILDRSQIDYSHFTDPINLGSEHSLPKSFEKATILCKRLRINETTEEQVLRSVEEALGYLKVIYDSYAVLGDLDSSDIATIVIQNAVNPLKKSSKSRQGYGLNPKERKAVENHAVLIVTEYLQVEGYDVKDVSKTASYDLWATRDKESIKVEVKGSTSDSSDAILMTANEVELHSSNSENTALAIVYDIRLNRYADPPSCSGGTLEYIFPSNLEGWDIVPTAYILKRSQQ